MPIYSYVALKSDNTTVKGRVEAQNAREAREKLRKQGFMPQKVKEEASKNDDSKARVKTKKVNLGVMSLKNKIDFTSTMQVLTATGIPIIEALMFLEGNADTLKVRNVACELRKSIIAGSTLAETVERHQSVFGKIYVGLVKAGEDSGELDKTLERMLTLLKKQDDIKGKVIGALIYPCFVIFIAIVVVMIMLMVVFPAFQSMFDTLGAQLPATTQFCINLGVWMKTFWFYTFIIIAAIVFLIIQAFRTPAIKKQIDKVVLKIPLLSTLMECSNFSNFIAVLQVAYDAGIPIIDCLYLANITMDNFVLKEAIKSAQNKVQQGTHLSVALRSTGRVPNMILFMISTGEQSGRLGELLYHCQEYLDKKLDSIIEKFTKLTEPVMLVVIGGIVLFLMLSLYQPLFGMYTNIGG